MGLVPRLSLTLRSREVVSPQKKQNWFPRIRYTLSGYTDAVISIDFSPGGKRVVTLSKEGDIKIWDAETGAEVSLCSYLFIDLSIYLSLSLSLYIYIYVYIYIYEYVCIYIYIYLGRRD